MRKKLLGLLNQDAGMVAVAAAMGLVAFLASAALALDMGHLLSVQNELQRAADAGAMAGARGLWPGTLPIIASTPPPDCTTAQNRALSAATNPGNQVDGGTSVSADVTVQVGRWNYNTKTFTPGCSSNTNAVQVTIQRNNIHTMFAAFLGMATTNRTATSTAVMDFAQGVGKGAMPIAISLTYAAPGQILFIDFNPEGKGGWFAAPPDSASAQTFQNYVDQGSCPPLNVGNLISLANGTDASVLHDLKDKLQAQGSTWDTVLPVVNTEVFNQSEPIVGFLPFRITAVDDTGNPKGVTGTVLGLLESATAAPGGLNYGVLAPPKMVN